MTDEPQIPNEPTGEEKPPEIEITVKAPVAAVSAPVIAAPREYVGRGTLPLEIAASEGARRRGAKTAILVCHGMGQQVQFSTLNDVVNALVHAEARAANSKKDTLKKQVEVNMVKCGDSLIPRAEVKLSDGNGEPHEVHLYEAYWASLTEGKVTMPDVLRFLFSAGWKGLEFARKPFWRWMFGGPKQLPFTKGTKAYLLVAALIVCSLTLLGISFLTALAGKVIAFFDLAAPNRELIDVLLVHVFLFILALLAAGVILGGVKFLGSLMGMKKRNDGNLPVFLRILNRLTILLLVLATLPVSASLLFHLSYWVWQSPENRQLLMLTELMRGWLGLVNAYAVETESWMLILRRVVYLVLWLLSFGVYSAVTSFFVRYVGDVAAYISAHKVSRFSELRSQIKEVGMKMARSAYELYDGESGQLEYDHVLVVGHSLGSVVAYDTLNAMINYDMSQAGALRVVERTRALITFGSPLDKTAFLFRAQLAGDQVDVRESLAAAVQPLIQSYALRPRRWTNIWSRLDWISGQLEYYDDPAALSSKHADNPKVVQNIEDMEASFPLAAHTEYWRHEIFGDTLYRELMEVRAEALQEQGH
jgi:pimeloyl-ACP methyl ester carboxylesterase